VPLREWDTASDNATRDEIVERGLKAALAALALSPNDKDAVVTTGLLYRVKAQLAPPGRRLEYLQKATELQERARGNSPGARSRHSGPR
jgi:hypothetical protein